MSLPVIHVGQIPEDNHAPRWLIEHLWGAEAVGFVGAPPKSAKTWMALDLVLSVASDTPCLGHYRVMQPGRALVYLAEDTLDMLRQRIQSIARHRGLRLDDVDLHAITAPRLRLDDDDDRTRLFQTVAAVKPRVLLLDPLIRLHTADENNAVEIAQLLSCLRELQKRFSVAIVVVHHTRKSGADCGQPGRALRGSGDLWAWADSALYLRRHHRHLVLTTEHRAAAAPDPVTLRLVDDDEHSVHLEVSGVPPCEARKRSLEDEIVQALGQNGMNRAQLRAALQVKNETLGKALQQLELDGRLQRNTDGWHLVDPTPD